MAFHATGLQSAAAVAAVATDLWPTLKKSVVAPWKAATLTSSPKASTSSPTRPNVDTHQVAASHQQSKSSVELPEFLRTALPTTPKGTHIAGTDIHSLVSSIPERTLAAANPLIQRSYRALFSRHIGLNPGFRHILAFQPTRTSSRSFTLAALSRRFSTGGVSPTLLTSRESAANRNPDSASAQNAFYQTLLKANMPAIVIERCQSGRFASNDATRDAYQKALMMTGASAGVGFPGSQASPVAPGVTSAADIQAISQAVSSQLGAGQYTVAKPEYKDAPIRVVVDESYSTIITRWVKFLFWFGFACCIGLMMVQALLEILASFSKPNSRVDSEVKPENQTMRFSDVHGCDEALEEVRDLVEFLKNPKKFASLGGKLPKGILLVGPPGTGKTLLAKAVAGEAGVPFFYMSGSEFDEVYVGVGAKRVRDLFAAAKSKSPSIVFIDELDAIGGRRTSREATYARQTLNQLLTELDGFDNNSGVIIIGATNFPNALDKALVRPGRFDRHVSVSLPDVRGRIKILQHHIKKIKTDSKIDLETIARTTSGMSGADLENLCNMAAIRASKLKAMSVTQKDLDWAKDQIIMGSEKKSMVISPLEKEMTAYHEAGHALVNFFSPDHGHKFYKVTILPRGQSLGHTSSLPAMDKYSYSMRDYSSFVDVALGGKVAEELRAGPTLTTSGVSQDLSVATRYAFDMVTKFGMSDKLGPMQFHDWYKNLSSETRAMVEAEVKRMLDEAYARTRTLLMSKRKELDLLAKALVEYETLDHDEVAKVIRGETLPNRIAIKPGPMVVKVPAHTKEEAASGRPGLTPGAGVSGSQPNEDGDQGGRQPPPVGAMP